MHLTCCVFFYVFSFPFYCISILIAPPSSISLLSILHSFSNLELFVVTQ